MTAEAPPPTDPAHLRRQVADQLDEIARLKAANKALAGAVDAVQFIAEQTVALEGESPATTHVLAETRKALAPNDAKESTP